MHTLVNKQYSVYKHAYTGSTLHIPNLVFNLLNILAYLVTLSALNKSTIKHILPY